ncbi:MBL fold metallo-hydrolase [Risungbinella massiliensis]|uniref:MBL fold metallo-hydrolase n=1 Tax=Risungbinella massiliensis TaxID=1329796 RepID=UPI0005CC2FF5|nr:MBL fold metallo-hydrolase [Risungbinella massiliensis]
MKDANRVEFLELNINGFVIYPTLVWDSQSAILIDTGMPGHVEQLRKAMEKVGVSFEQLTAIIITHQDIDHMGGLPEILSNTRKELLVYAHELEKPYIEGTYPLIKTDLSRMTKEEIDALPEEMRKLYAHPPKAKVTHTLSNGQVLPFVGGIQVIETPGHTDGHVCLYLQQSKTLVAADAMYCVDGMLGGPHEPTALDIETARQSLTKLLDFEIDSVICYHGGICKENVSVQLKKLTKKTIKK